MTWGEFKQAVEAAGVTDSNKVTYIDWSDSSIPKVKFWHDSAGTFCFCVHGGSSRYSEDQEEAHTS